MIIEILISIIVLIVAGVLFLASRQSSEMTVTRSLVINETSDKFFPLINDFHNWSKWSPYERLDLQMQKTYSGADFGVGSIYDWSGNSKVGKGKMEIIQSTPAKVVLDLNFEKPFKSHSITEFLFEQKGNQTKVTWLMSGPTPYIMKIMKLFINTDKMLGKDFESGLNSLKLVAEKQ